MNLLITLKIISLFFISSGIVILTVSIFFFHVPYLVYISITFNLINAIIKIWAFSQQSTWTIIILEGQFNFLLAYALGAAICYFTYETVINKINIKTLLLGQRNRTKISKICLINEKNIRFDSIINVNINISTKYNNEYGKVQKISIYRIKSKT
jgi:hypothetical protein